MRAQASILYVHVGPPAPVAAPPSSRHRLNGCRVGHATTDCTISLTFRVRGRLLCFVRDDVTRVACVPASTEVQLYVNVSINVGTRLSLTA
eukprot:3655904-Prymnesium_polylepis.1